MPTVIVKLNPNFEKPVVGVEHGQVVNAIIDTGAHISAYFGTKDDLIDLFPDAEETSYIAWIGGFGGNKRTFCEIMKVPYIAFHDELSLSQFRINNLLLAVCNMDEPYDILLAGTLFNKVDLCFLYRNDPCSMKIEFDRDVYCIHGVLEENKVIESEKQLIKSTKTFLQLESGISPCNAFQ